jgi:hypothetical protein
VSVRGENGIKVFMPGITSSWTRNPYSAANYKLMDDESTAGIGFLPAHGQGFCRRNGIPSGITSSSTRNPTKITIPGSATPNFCILPMSALFLNLNTKPALK